MNRHKVNKKYQVEKSIYYINNHIADNKLFIKTYTIYF